MTPREANKAPIADRAERVSEAALQKAIIKAAHLHGWRVAHFRPARTKNGWRTAVEADGKGWPDLVLVRERVVFAELKRQHESLSPHQSEWLERLDYAGAEAYLWRPSHWLEGEIDRILV